MSDKNFMSYEDAEEVLTEYADDIKENRTTATANEANITKIFADIAETEEETALADHAIGDYILLDGVFFKVTAAIETGDSIVENTNVERATIDEILKVLREDIDKKQDYIFRGTHAEWEALTTEQKAIYDLVAFTDDLCADGDAYISGTVAEGDYNAVSSDAVYSFVNDAVAKSEGKLNKIGATYTVNKNITTPALTNPAATSITLPDYGKWLVIVTFTLNKALNAGDPGVYNLSLSTTGGVAPTRSGYGSPNGNLGAQEWCFDKSATVTATARFYGNSNYEGVTLTMSYLCICIGDPD